MFVKSYDYEWGDVAIPQISFPSGRSASRIDSSLYTYMYRSFTSFKLKLPIRHCNRCACDKYVSVPNEYFLPYRLTEFILYVDARILFFLHVVYILCTSLLPHSHMDARYCYSYVYILSLTSF